MKSSIPLRRACRSCFSGEGRGESVPVEFSGEMTAESRSKRRSRLRRCPLLDHTEDAPGSRNGPSPPARRAVNTGRPVFRAVRRASASSCSSSPSCHAWAGVRSSRHVEETCGGGLSSHGAMEKTASSSVLRMPKTGTRSFPCGAGGITACRGKERPFLNRWNRIPSASAAPSSRGDVRYFPCQVGQGRPVLGPEAAAQSQFTGMHAAEGQRRTEDELRACVQAGAVQFHDGSEVSGKVAGNGFRLDESCLQHATER